MNILVLIPRPTRFEYALFDITSQTMLLESHIDGLLPENDDLVELLQSIKVKCMEVGEGDPDLVTIRAAYGGSLFSQTTQVNAGMLRRYETLAVEAPIHVPCVCRLATVAMKIFWKIPVMMSFETAFFASLPDREKRYAIADNQVRRFGYHGLYHQGASNAPNHRRKSGATRTLSLCLEPQPEIAAMLDHYPVQVTSGTTPLEGLPGETTCGELDPTIVLTLARSLKWGPEQINGLLTRQSGLYGLTGNPIALGEILTALKWSKEGRLQAMKDELKRNACKILAYRILLACGAGVAAMGGVDRIILTGRYAKLGRKLGIWLAHKLALANRNQPQSIPVLLYQESLPQLLAEQAFWAIHNTEAANARKQVVCQ